MEKPYQLGDLKKKLVEKGLPEVEELAEKCYAATKEWIQESAALSKTPIDDVIVSAFPFIDGLVKPQLDKIDGKAG